MNESQRQHLEQRLQEERERTVRALERSDEATRTSALDDGELTNYSQHPADEGTDTMEQEKALMLLSQEGQRLVEIDRALRRLIRDPERFGRCAGCGNEISLERLELVPWATLCTNCQAEREVGG
jgi:DnaK suppressor protein